MKSITIRALIVTLLVQLFVVMFLIVLQQFFNISVETIFWSVYASFLGIFFVSYMRGIFDDIAKDLSDEDDEELEYMRREEQNYRANSYR